MGERGSRKLEAAANASIILLAAVASMVLVKNSFLKPAPVAAKPASRISESVPPAGTRISLPGVNWGASERNLIVALSTNCHFCSESSPFYQRLASEAQQSHAFRLIGVLPQESSEGSKYLEGMGVKMDQVVQSPLESIRTRGTPTLILVDNNGVVRQTWVGRLTPDKESDVIRSVASTAPA